MVLLLPLQRQMSAALRDITMISGKYFVTYPSLCISLLGSGPSG